MLCNATKMYGILVRERVPTQAKMQSHNDSRPKQKCMLGEMQATSLAWAYLVSCICETK